MMTMQLTDYLAAIDRLDRHADFNGAMVVTDAHRTLYTYAGGLADIEKEIPFTLDTVTGIGSLTKQFIAVAVMQQVSAGRLALTDRLDQYVPEYRYAAKVTLGDLLTMASGIPDYPSLIQNQHPTTTAAESDPQSVRRLGADLSLAELVALINPIPLDFHPGSQGAYSNTNYNLLGIVVSRVLGQPLDQILTAYIWQPLGMTVTELGTQNATAVSYLPWHDELRYIGKGSHTTADSGLVTSAKDYTLWLQAVLQQSETLLPRSAWQTIFTITHNFYGMGWFQHRQWFWHSGLILGYQADVFLSFDLNLAVFWLTNVRFLTTSAKDWNRQQRIWLDALE
ncbi:serine hydrolase domain-containing protein [Schleiferilactobacillus perolens]|nr:serine hydrolase domain-containing protein [Schleiferilactobacillus perolens]